MNKRLIMALWFGLGVGLQAHVLIRGDWNWKRLAGCIGIGFLGMFPGRNEHQYQPFVHMLMCFGFFSCSFAMAFKDDILPVVSEKVLLFYSLIFWFAFFSYFYKSTALQNILLFILLPPSTATVFICFARSPGRRSRSNTGRATAHEGSEPQSFRCRPEDREDECSSSYPSARLQFLFRIQRQLDHAFEQLIRR